MNRTIESCIVETQGYPYYRDETRYYIAENGLIKHGPFKHRDEAEQGKRFLDDRDRITSLLHH